MMAETWKGKVMNSRILGTVGRGNSGRLVLAGAMALGLACAGCRQFSMTARSFPRNAPDGTAYTCEVVKFKHDPVVTVFLGREGGPGKAYPLTVGTNSEHVEQLTLNGVPIEPAETSTARFSANGKLQSVPISNTGVWTPFYSKKGPTVDDLQRAFAELEREGF
jgi:hypothetical protein